MNDSTAERGRTPTPSSAELNSGAHPVVKPVLASEVLREELAPLQPGGASCRVVLLGTAAALAMLGVALRGGVGADMGAGNAASMTFGIAGATAAVALLPFPYLWRAILCVALGTVLIVFGVRGSGPLAGLMDDGAFRGASRLLALLLLPAALFFRAKYRAYRPARLVLAAAMLASVPFVILQAILLVDADAAVALRGGALVGIVVVSCGLLGFMGEDTTGAGAVCGSLQLGLLSADIALRELGAAGARFAPFSYAAAGVGTACAGALVSVGLYQVLASILARDARRTTMKPEPPRGPA